MKAFFIDLDNTLYDYNRCNDAGLKKVISFLKTKLGKDEINLKKILKESRDEVKIRTKKTGSSHSRLLYFKTLIEKIKGKTDGSLTHQANKVFWDEFISTIKIYPFVKEFLALAKKKGLMIAILTDLTTDIQLRKIEKSGLREMVDYIFASEEVIYDKPDEALFSYALDTMGLKSDEVIMIGDDRAKDIEGAKKVGIKGILIENQDSWKEYSTWFNF